MTVVSIILGVLLVICGFSCMFTPLATFLSTGVFLCVLLLVYGIIGVVRFFQKESGVLELIVSILAIIVGVICVVNPVETLNVSSLVLWLIAAWLVIEGLVSIIVSVSERDVRKGWGWGVFAGILGILVGIYSFAHPVLEAVAAGMLIGFYFVQAGFDMIVLGSVAGKAKKEFEAAAKREDSQS